MTLDASRAQRQGLGGRLGRPPLEMPEHEYLSLTRGKPLKSAPDPIPRLPLERRPLRRRFAVDEIDLLDRARSGPPAPPPPGAPPVVAGVEADPREPGGPLCGRVGSLEALRQPQEDLLRDFLGLLGIVQKEVTEAHHLLNDSE